MKVLNAELPHAAHLQTLVLALKPQRGVVFGTGAPKRGVDRHSGKESVMSHVSVRGTVRERPSGMLPTLRKTLVHSHKSCLGFCCQRQQAWCFKASNVCMKGPVTSTTHCTRRRLRKQDLIAISSSVPFNQLQSIGNASWAPFHRSDPKRPSISSAHIV